MLVRDVLYACQGIDGKYLRWQPASCGGSGGYAANAGVTLPLAEQQLTLQLCELGWLFRRVGFAVRNVSGTLVVGYDA